MKSSHLSIIILLLISSLTFAQEYQIVDIEKRTYNRDYQFIDIDTMINDLKSKTNKSIYHTDSYLQELIRMDYSKISFVYEIKPDFLKDFREPGDSLKWLTNNLTAGSSYRITNKYYQNIKEVFGDSLFMDSIMIMEHIPDYHIAKEIFIMNGSKAYFIIRNRPESHGYFMDYNKNEIILYHDWSERD